MDLVALNQMLFDEFHRITGVTNRFLFPQWYAAITREVIAGLPGGERGAIARWGRLTRQEQRELILSQLRARPPAHWPDLRLAPPPPPPRDLAPAARAELRRQLQAILDGIDEPAPVSRVA